MQYKFVRRTGFTLIELLVVIAIISILAAILFPVFGRARANARRASGLSNLKQIGLGLQQYIQDYDGRYPPHVTERQGTQYFGVTDTGPDSVAPFSIRAKLQPYVKSIQLFKDPSAPDWPTPATGGWHVTDYGFHLNESSYNSISPSVYTQYYTTNPTFGFNENTLDSVIQEPAKFIVSGDTSRPAQGASYNPSRGGLYPFEAGPANWIDVNKHELGTFPFDGGIPYTTGQAAPTPRHLGGTNFLFADGHAKWYKLEQTWRSFNDNFWRYDRP
jgi:prepilin-type N-terminal cleavage/methylation domain-containing protein/prepilin-type processing-associated H-X9-DG protein